MKTLTKKLFTFNLVFFLILSVSNQLFSQSNWQDREDPRDFQQIIYLQGSSWPENLYLYNNQTLELYFCREVPDMVNALVRIDNGSWYNEYDDDLMCVTVEPFNYMALLGFLWVEL